MWKHQILQLLRSQPCLKSYEPQLKWNGTTCHAFHLLFRTGDAYIRKSETLHTISIQGKGHWTPKLFLGKIIQCLIKICKVMFTLMDLTIHLEDNTNNPWGLTSTGSKSPQSLSKMWNPRKEVVNCIYPLPSLKKSSKKFLKLVLIGTNRKWTVRVAYMPCRKNSARDYELIGEIDVFIII